MVFFHWKIIQEVLEEKKVPKNRFYQHEKLLKPDEMNLFGMGFRLILLYRCFALCTNATRLINADLSYWIVSLKNGCINSDVTGYSAPVPELLNY
ncbi:hypothetical protein A3D03_04690 [Candidatus Gottesmanbacteria bacterium RIFCSPHIGHO2_02_FULL_40_13]|uniref:Uncharacterized protein n=1 Tax=Candidatus Gottesmanbacteria bacterium RIFCSPHIGHO2_02_FULL_40_13 TaxID=1798384 RepID=A0A1F6ABR0_9BACT|nr:MAG: hypothetical protein A3D03_04690 [Candidatus Gottesmanbacteria bacterium RIFCSPHIGHO2_02_FULL_40_13]